MAIRNSACYQYWQKHQSGKPLDLGIWSPPRCRLLRDLGGTVFVVRVGYVPAAVGEQDKADARLHRGPGGQLGGAWRVCSTSAVRPACWQRSWPGRGRSQKKSSFCACDDWRRRWRRRQ